MPCGTYAVIPVKSFVSAKQRLAPILNNFERARLARLMLEDVLDAVRSARKLAGFCVVTNDGEAAALAASRGGQVVRDSGELGLSHAVRMALLELADVAKGAVVVPSDIPHLPSATIDTVVEKTSPCGVALVPAICDGGTNLLSLRPWHVLLPQFGPASFYGHARAALRAGVAAYIHVCPMTSHDLDRPGDLITFLSFRSQTRAHAYLAGLGIGERLAETDGLRVPVDRVRTSA